jgi:hypothetical protein
LNSCDCPYCVPIILFASLSKIRPEGVLIAGRITIRCV